MKAFLIRALSLAMLVAIPASYLAAQEEDRPGEVPVDRQEATSEGGDKANDVTLREVVVKGEQFIKKSPFTINIVDSKDIEKRGISKTADIIKEVPGVKMHEYDQGGVSNAVSIRGFQSGVHGGDMGVYLDGIPLNEYYGHGGGYADPNVLIPMELDRVLVYKGPSSALYGNFSRGGTIVYMTRKGGDYVNTHAKYGSWNTVDIQAALGKSVISDTLWNNTAVQFYRTDGFQDNSRQLYGNGSTRFTYRPAKDLEISLSLRGHGHAWDAPGYMSRAQWGVRKWAYKQQMFNPLNMPLDPLDVGQDDGGDRRQFTERLDINYVVNEYAKILAWGFGLQTNWTRFAKFGSGAQYERGYRIGKYGAGASLNLDVPIHEEIRMKGIVGYEYCSDDTVFRQFGTQNRTRLSITGKKYSRFQTHGLFLESEWTLHQYFSPVVGLRADLFAGEFRNKMYLQEALNITDPLKQWMKVQERHQVIGPGDYSAVTPKFGFISDLVKDVLRFRANVSNGFVMPPDTTLYQTWQHLEPAKIWQYEGGLTATYEKYLWVDVTGYMIDVTDEAREEPAGSGFYTNIGTTRRWGVEATAKIMPLKYLEVDGTFTWMRSRVREVPWFGTNAATSYVSVGNVLTKGSPLPNIPEFQGGVEVIWNTPINLGGGVGWTFVGRQYTDAYGTRTWSRAMALYYLNSTYGLGLGEAGPTYGGYNLFDLYLSYTLTASEAPIVFRFDAKNILNEHYAGYAGNYTIWAPGAPRSFYGSVSMKL
jgi:outer membrane receptor protein involved in Fe transport